LSIKKDQIMSKRYICSRFHFICLIFTAAALTCLSVGCKRGEPGKAGDASQAAGKESKSAAESTSTSGTKLDTGRAVLEAMAKAYRTAKTYNDKGSLKLFIQAGDQKNEKVDFLVAFQRPNKLRMEVYQANVVIDGKKLYATIGDLPGQVLEKPAPAELTMKSVYCDYILTSFLTSGFAGAAPQLLLLLNDDSLDILLRDAEEPKLVEPGQIGDRDCYRVQIRRLDGMTVMWIDKETLVLRRMVLPTDDLRRDLSARLPAPIESISFTAEFSSAELNAPIDPKAFEFQVPEGSEIVSVFIPPNPAQLLAKKVPDFKFVDLSGKPVTPESLAGKITVMDFWATTCDPCRISLPNLQKIYEKYKDNDKVAFLAVSVDEPQVENKAIEDAFKELKVSIPICRDMENTAIKFKFSGIPSTFIIDAGGTVQDFEMGANPELTAAIPDKIEKLLAGENIYEAPLKEYQEQLKKYMSGREGENGAKVEEQPVPKTNISEAGKPRTFKLSPLWKCTDLKSPGNILVLSSPDSPSRLIVIDNYKSLAEVGLDGKLIASHDLKLGDEEFVTNLRSFRSADGKNYIAAFAGAQQRCHLLDDQWKVILSYPEDALQNPHKGISDVQLGDLDGDGAPKMYVGYSDVVGVQAVSLEGKRLWAKRTVSNVIRMAITGPDADGKSELLCTNSSGSIAVFDAKGQQRPEISVSNRLVYWIAGADLLGNKQRLWCGLAASKLGESVALGLNLKGDELWSYNLPVGVQPQPIEFIIAGKISSKGPGQWILPGPDGSINILSADGKPVDSFNYGAMLQGLATVEIDGQPALIVASPNGLEAWKID
jgi:thiol-disulfide isomerase/thioredoxin